jgi:hypothetical protein
MTPKKNKPPAWGGSMSEWRWRPMTESPPAGTSVLICRVTWKARNIPPTADSYGPYVGWFNGRGWTKGDSDRHGEWTLIAPTHWMPLPELPKPSIKENQEARTNNDQEKI